MRKHIFILLLSFSSSLVFTQKYTKAIVTQVGLFRNTTPLVNGKAFPFYVHHQDFKNDIMSDIEMHCKSQFGVSEVQFVNENSITLLNGELLPKSQSKKIAKLRGVNGEVYLDVLTYLHQKGYAPNEIVFGFSTRIKAFNHKGKQVFKSKTTTPFSTTVGEEITGEVELGESDFYLLYFEGLKYAFLENSFPDKLYIQKPPTDYYTNFLSDATKMFYQFKENAIMYGAEIESAKSRLQFKDMTWQFKFGKFGYLDFFEVDRVIEGYRVNNSLTGENYLVRLKGSKETVLNSLLGEHDITVQFKNEKKELISELTYNDKDLFFGTYNTDSVKVKWNTTCYTKEFYVNDKLIAVINDLPDRSVVYVSKYLTQYQQGELINLFFAYEFSIAIRNKIQDEL